LVGVQVNLPWLERCAKTKVEDLTATAQLANGQCIHIEGDLELQRWEFCGGLISNATRLASRQDTTITSLQINLLAGLNNQQQRNILQNTRPPQQALKKSFPDVPPRFWHLILPSQPSKQSLQDILTNWEVPVTGNRPLKEAMVTVGGVACDEVNSNTMESRHCPGLYFAGEVLDIDGPTGGFNLQLAFATAQLAIHAITEHPHKRPTQRQKQHTHHRNKHHHRKPHHR
jgi:predicted flavoprotein YhiN